MMRIAAGVSVFTLVTASFGEQGLRGLSHVQGALALDSATVKDILHRIEQAPHHEAVDDVLRNSDHKDVAVMNASEMFAFFFVWFILYVPIAVYYFACVRWSVEDFSSEAIEHKMAKHASDGHRALNKFSSGLFHCNKQPQMTFWSCCCPGIRWADTMDKLGIHRFWGGFWIMTCLYFISFIPKATLCCQLLVVMYMTYHRQVLRQAFEFEEQGGASWVSDCCTYMCCMCCAVAQEARHTRIACTVHHAAIRHSKHESNDNDSDA